MSGWPESVRPIRAGHYVRFERRNGGELELAYGIVTGNPRLRRGVGVRVKALDTDKRHVIARRRVELVPHFTAWEWAAERRRARAQDAVD